VTEQIRCWEDDGVEEISEGHEEILRKMDTFIILKRLHECIYM
jgi:hypothetical protein